MQVKDLNWPVKISTIVHASAREVWQLISTPGNLEKFHPYCAKNPVKHFQSSKFQSFKNSKIEELESLRTRGGSPLAKMVNSK